MDTRMDSITRFMTGMTDIKVHRHPLKSLVILTFCDVKRDIYGDSFSEVSVEGSYQKEIILQKNPNLDYINSTIGELLDDGDQLPWIMILTLTGLPRTLRHGDFMTVDGKAYKVSGVQPCNRENPNIIQAYCHPSRDFELDIKPVTDDYNKFEKLI